MPEVKKAVKTIMVYKYCDRCGEEMHFTGQTLLSSPPQHIHVCEKCGYTDTCPNVYPYLLYEQEEDGEEIQRKAFTRRTKG